MQDNVIKGNIYEIDYLSQCLFRQENCSLLESVTVTFENGNKQVFSSEEYFQLQQKQGKIKEVHYESKQGLQTKRVLETLQQQKETTQRGNIKQYIQRLENKNVNIEKETVSPSLQNIKKPSIKKQLQQNEKKETQKNNIKKEEVR